MSDPAAEYLRLYEEYNKSLRTWFLSFGIGAIVLLLSNDALASKFAKSPEKAYIVAAFLTGCFLQVFIALLNKMCSWCMYAGCDNQFFQQSWYHKCASIINAWFWLDVILDITTFGLFGYAVYSLTQIYL